MSGWQTIAYLLRHLWLWPLVFWLRPLEVDKRMRQNGREGVELWCALLGSILWGALLGTGVWLCNGEVQAIWQLALAFAVTYTISFSFSFSPSGGSKIVGEFIVILAIFLAAVSFFYSHIVISLAVAVAFAINVSFSILILFTKGLSSNIFILIFIGTIYIGLAYTGIMLGLWLPSIATSLGPTIIISLGLIGAGEILKKKYLALSKWLFWTSGILFILLLPCIGFSFFLQASDNQIPIWGLFLVFSFITNIQANLLHRSYDLQNAIQQVDCSSWTFNGWLKLFYILFGLFALAAWWPAPKTNGLDAKLDELALFFAVTAPIATGLPFWPLLCLMAAWRFRSSQVQRHNQQTFVASLPFQWQSFAYPLPGLRSYLTALGRLQSADSAFRAIQAVQLRSLQMRAARLAAADLAAVFDTALGFCGHVAITCNTTTLLPLTTTGSLARTVAVLAKSMDKEAEQPLLLYVADYPPASLKLKRWNFSLAAEPQADWHDEFELIRSDSLTMRLAYALRLLSDFSLATDAQEFSALLRSLSAYADWDFRNVQNLPPTRQTKDHAPWLNQGWTVLEQLETLLQPLAVYRELTTPSARRELLENKAAELQSVTWKGVSEYWAAIGQELLALWSDKLQQEAHLAREWLRLEAQLSNDRLGLGVQTLQLQVRNPTGLLASNVRFQVQATKGLDWHHNEAKQPLLEGGTTVIIRLELEANRIGSFRVAGQLQAEDVSGNAYSLPLAFQVHVAEAGRAYRLLDYQPYVTGEGLGDERTFVGRHELLHWLRGLWLQPQGKPAVALVGQRRMGKTSLLNKIRRDGLPDTGLLPVLVNVQGVSGDYDFLHSVAREMAVQLSIPQPVLHRDTPYPDFKDFLLGLANPLQGRRFVLLLDEADLIPQRHLGDLLPGFLRALMQEPQYPTLLLFCGTHGLKDMSRDYSSILFNTVQFRPVSYMTEAESAEVLTKPAGDALEFDPAVLAEAYRLTLGQPLLLQSLGAALIDYCNGVVLNGGERSNYILPPITLLK